MATVITAGNATNGLSLSADNTGAFEFKTGTGAGTTAIYVDASQNVGIGTSSPAYRLNVQSAGTAATINRDVVLRTGDQTNFYRLSMVYNTTTASGAFPAQSGGLYWEYGGGFGVSGGLVISTNNANAGPIILGTANVERMRIDSSGNVLVTNPAGLGYGTGAGGTVTQGTSRTTGVTLNKPTGAITMFTAAGSATAASFTVTNSIVSATDTISLSQKSGTNLYNFIVTAVADGSFRITFYTTGGTASDAPVINFNVIKGITA
jgi:hypothetical protein